jgi:hypothetical protein
MALHIPAEDSLDHMVRQLLPEGNRRPSSEESLDHMVRSPKDKRPSSDESLDHMVRSPKGNRPSSEESLDHMVRSPKGNRPSPEESLDHMVRQLPPKSRRPSLVNRASRGLARFLIIFCIGVAATLAWQSYGDDARKMIADSSPRFGWLAPQAARNGTPSPEFATMRRSVDQLAANQQQMAGDIAKLLTDQKELLQKISAPLSPAHARSF